MIILHIVLGIVIAIVVLFVLTFLIYFFNLDMKMVEIITPILEKHYDKVKKKKRL